MRTTITIEIEAGETLQEAIARLTGAGVPTPSVPEPKTAPETEAKSKAKLAPKAKAPAKKAEVAPAEVPAPEAADETQDVAPGKAEVAFEDVRAAASKAMNSGKRDEVEDLITDYSDTGKLSGVAKADYPVLLEKIEAL